MYGLSFSEEFFTGSGEVDIYETPTSEHPTSVYQAAISLPLKERIEISREVFGYDEETAKIHAEGESFGIDVVDKVRETDLCDTLESPIEVYIDDECNYSLTIYEDGRCPKCNELLDKDCFGGLRCPECDEPCPGCHDGGGPGADDDEEGEDEA